MSEKDICERLERLAVMLGAEDNPGSVAVMTCIDADVGIRMIRDTLRRADELLAEGVGAAEEGDTADWRARVREFLGERS